MQKPYTLAGGSSLSCDNKALGGIWSSGCSFRHWLQSSRTYWELGHLLGCSLISKCVRWTSSLLRTHTSTVCLDSGWRAPGAAWETSPVESPSSSQSILDIWFVLKSLHQTRQPSVNRVSTVKLLPSLGPLESHPSRKLCEGNENVDRLGCGNL